MCNRRPAVGCGLLLNARPTFVSRVPKQIASHSGTDALGLGAAQPLPLGLMLFRLCNSSTAALARSEVAEPHHLLAETSDADPDDLV